MLRRRVPVTSTWPFLGFILFCLTDLSFAHLNLFVNKTEANRLIGYDAELAYIRNGRLNDYALSFNMPVKAAINSIYFNWRSLRETPPEPSMRYNIELVPSEHSALYRPRISIPRKGFVPTRKSGFSVDLICNGKEDAEVDFSLKLKIGIHSNSNKTTLTLHRRKTCVKGQDGGKKGAQYRNLDEERTSSDSSQSFYIAIGVSCFLIFAVALLVLLVYVRCSRRTSTPRKCALGSQRPDTPNTSLGSGGMSTVSRVPLFTPIPELSDPEIDAALREMEIDQSQVTCEKILMEGNYGKIIVGSVRLPDSLSNRQVWMKTTNELSRVEQKRQMLREASLLLATSHPNVCTLLAAVLGPAPTLLYGFINEGNLKKYLHRFRGAESSVQPLNTQQLVYLALQVARGAQYLHRRRILHKDIATRNCVVNCALSLQITDSALSRDLFPQDYYCLGQGEFRPIKWLSLEALLEHRYSPASDVWSFGVTLWELMTLAGQPYQEVDPGEMGVYLKEGYRMVQPANCPDELFAVMACCWASSPDERPRFSQLQICLQDFYSALGRFV